MRGYWLSAAVAAALVAGSAFAGTLSGEFKFEKSPPSVALVYFTEDHSLSKAKSPTVDQKDKKFVQKMMVGAGGAKIHFNNSDSVDHNIYANDAKTGVSFDAGLVPPGQHSEADLSWKENEVVKIGCKIHPKMQAYIANVSSAFYKVVEFSADAPLTFDLEKVPEKYTKIRIWFPKQDPIEAEIKKGETKSIDITEKGQPSGSVKLVRK
jgi:hypothetical protein